MSSITAANFPFTPNQNAVASAIASANDAFDSSDADTAGYISDTLDMAMTQGMNPLTAANYLSFLVGPGRSENIARTEMLGGYRDAANALYKDNADVVSGWMWSAAAGCCVACSEEDGTIHDLDEDMDGETHNCCRCSPIPITAPWSDILGPLGIDASDIAETNILEDYVPMSETFMQRSFEEQAAMLGSKSAAEAVSRGLLQPSDFVGHVEGGAYDGALYTKSLREALADAKGLDAGEIASVKSDLLAAVRGSERELGAAGAGIAEEATAITTDAERALSADDLKAAIDKGALERVRGSGANDSYHAEINGQQYFIKKLNLAGYNSPEDEALGAVREAAANDMAQVVGLGDYVTGAQAFTVDGAQYVVEPYMADAKMLSTVGKYSTDKAAVMRELMPRQDIESQALLNYLVGDRDRSFVNYLVTQDNRLLSIDYGEAFTVKDAVFEPGYDELLKGLMNDEQLSEYIESGEHVIPASVRLAPDSVQRIVEQGDTLVKMATDAGIDTAPIEARLAVLQSYVDQGGTNLRDLVDISRGETLTPSATTDAEQALSAAQSHVADLVQSGIADRRAITAAQWDVAQAQAAVDAEQGGRGAAILISGSTSNPLDTTAFTQASDNLFGRQLSRDELGGLVGAPEGSFVNAVPGSDGQSLNFIMHGPGWVPGDLTSQGQYEAWRTLARDANGDLMMNNYSFIVRGDMRGQGLGASILGDEVDTLSQLDVKYIETDAAGSAAEVASGVPDPRNGYYTWARLGYDASLPQDARDAIGAAIARGQAPASWGSFDNLSELMTAPGGSEWWKANGIGMQMHFDLSEGSYSRDTLADYLRTRGLR